MRTTFIKAKYWQLCDPPEEIWKDLARSLSISDFLAKILVNRGLTKREEAENFLNPQISHLHSPYELEGIFQAVERILRAIERREKVCVYGDFDVDGITSTALLVSVLKELEAKVCFFIPNRFEEGYGLSVSTLDRLKAEGVSLVISVDCGTTAVKEAEFCLHNNLDLIITDHHEPGEMRPHALALINPKINQQYPFRELAGVGVVFKLCQALFYSTGRADAVENLKKNLDLVALGTIADIVPLLGENRVFAYEGLKRINRSRRPGIRALIEVSGLEGRTLEAHQVGFWLAPRLNAGGRLSQANQGVELLLTSDFEKARQIALSLDQHNQKRRSLEEKIYQEAVARIETEMDLERELVILLQSEEWHEGVKGIVASRLVDRFCRPVFLFTVKKSEASGSARSIPGFHLSQVLSRVKDLLISYGGHAFAAGVKVAPNRLDELRYRLNCLAEEILSPDDLTPKLKIDCQIALSNIDYSLASELEVLAPYGMGNPPPVMISQGIYLKNCKIVGKGRHLQFLVQDDAYIQEGIAFNIDRDTARRLKGYQGLVDLAFRLEKNLWQGKEQIQLKLTDIRIKDEGLPERDPWLENLFSNAYKLIKNEEYKNIGDSECFYTKLVGVTFENRQQMLENVSKGSEVRLIREPQNPFDPNAVRIEDKNGRNLGYLNARLAKQLAPYLDQGITFNGIVTEVTGEGKNNEEGKRKYRGINLEIRKQGMDDQTKAITEQESKKRKRLSSMKQDELIEEVTRLLLENQPLHDKQREVLHHLVSGNNCLAIMGTGRGKSLIFYLYSAIKAIKEDAITLVIFPLRALVNDQHHYMSIAFERLGLKVVQLSGDIDANHREAAFCALEAGKANVVLTTPEFLYHHQLKFGKIKNKITFFVVDESHHICTSTQAHRPLYKKLKEVISELGWPQVLAVTATAGDRVAGEICKSLNIDKIVVDPTVRDNLKLRDLRETSSKEEYLKKWIAKGEKSIVYVNSREQSVEVASFLRDSLPHLKNKVVFYNAGLNKEIRSIIEERFRKGEFRAVVATSAFGEGINIPDVRHVFLYHLNFSFIEFNQQSGRAGRDGGKAYIHLLFGEEDAKINEFILESSTPSKEKLAELYRVLRKQVCGKKETVITLSNQELVYELELSLGRSPLNEKGVAAGLKILEELRLLELEGSGSYRRIHLLPLPKKKLNLEECSVRYEEGVHEKELFKNFKNWALRSGEEELLKMINQPIYPKDSKW